VTTPTEGQRDASGGDDDLAPEPALDAGGFFDAPLLEELRELARVVARRPDEPGAAGGLPAKLGAFLAPEAGGAPLDEAAFAALSGAPLTERANRFIGLLRDAPERAAADDVENFVVFFRALVPTLSDTGSVAVKRAFFRLAPSLLQMAHDASAAQAEKGAEARAALADLERVLLEIASVRLAPLESELVLKSIDQMVAFMSAADYALASALVSTQLLSLITRNKLTRALYRLMEVEVGLQRYLKARLGYATPQVRLPGDAAALAEYGPLRIFDEPFLDGVTRRLVQVHVPNIPSLRDVVLHLVSAQTGHDHALRLDRLGSAELSLPDGLYAIGLSYEPQG
jgi:hypothetical protein